MIEYQEPHTKKFKRYIRLLLGLLNGKKAHTGPFWADLDITRRCNLRCLGCLYHSPLVTPPDQPNPQVRDMSYDLARRVIRELATMGAHTIIIQGAGEPLLHPRLFDIIASVKDQGLFCRLLTNGTLLDNSMAQRLIESGLDSLRISIWANSPEELQIKSNEEESRKFSKILRGIEVLKKVKKRKNSTIPKVELHQVMTRKNYRSVDGFIKLAMEHHCSGIHFGHLISRRGQLDVYALSSVEETASLGHLARLRPLMEKQGIQHNIDTLSLRYSLGERVWEHAACFTPWFRLRVLTDGTVKVCRGHDQAFGHLDTQSLEAVWNGKALKRFRRSVSTREGLARLAETSDCRACCFFTENLRVEGIYRWLRPYHKIFNTVALKN